MEELRSGRQPGPEADFIHDPAWFPEGFDGRSGEFLLVAADRPRLASQSFLDPRWDRTGAPRSRLSAKALPAEVPTPKPKLIWHTGFCCSTLLAKSLDRTGCNLSLCEPQVLVDVAEAARSNLLSADMASNATRMAFHLLSRPFAARECITLKPSPAANRLLHEAASRTSGPMLFLYSDCRSFVVSICRMGEGGRKYVRRLFLALLADGHAQAQWPAPKLLSLSDLELAAIVWHMQIAEFLRHRPLLGPVRAASLDCDAFLAAPVETLDLVDQFFSLGLGRDYLDPLAAGPLFRRNAKTGEELFDARRRREEYSRIEEQMGGDLDRIVAQSYAICRTTPRDSPLPEPLVPIDKVYCP